MYGITYKFSCGGDEFCLDYNTNTPEEASRKLVSLSIKHPVRGMRFGEQEYFFVRVNHYFCKKERFCKWKLDYSEEELAKMIREALPKGGLIWVGWWELIP